MALMATTYIAGALIYGCRFPERVMPGKFNFFVSITHKKKNGKNIVLKF